MWEADETIEEENPRLIVSYYWDSEPLALYAAEHGDEYMPIHIPTEVREITVEESVKPHPKMLLRQEVKIKTCVEDAQEVVQKWVEATMGIGTTGFEDDVWYIGPDGSMCGPAENGMSYLTESTGPKEHPETETEAEAEAKEPSDVEPVADEKPSKISEEARKMWRVVNSHERDEDVFLDRLGNYIDSAPRKMRPLDPPVRWDVVIPGGTSDMSVMQTLVDMLAYAEEMVEKNPAEPGDFDHPDFESYCREYLKEERVHDPDYVMKFVG